MYKALNNMRSTFNRLNKNKIYRWLFLVVIVLIVGVYILIKIIKPNISEPVDHQQKIIYFGETCDLENNNASKEYSTGYQLAFSYINKHGGINGYYIKLILLNDSYEPDQSVKNAKLLIDYYNVLAIIGSFGTHTTIAILENAIGERPIPLIGPYTASMSIRQNFNPYLITTNPGFSVEFDLITENLLQNSFHNISVLYQDDLYGHIFYTSYVNYIIKNNLHINIVSTGKYIRNSDDLENTMETIFGNTNPYDYASYKKEDINKTQAIIVFSAEKEISSILGIVKTISPKVAIYYNSFVGNDPQNVEYLADKDKTHVYQTLSTHTNLDEYPEMKNILLPEINEHNKKDIKIEHTATSSLIQGFYSGLLIGKVLQNFKDMRELNRKTFLDMFYKMRTINVYGLEMGPFIMQENNQALHYAELNQLQSNLTFKPIKTIQ